MNIIRSILVGVFVLILNVAAAQKYNIKTYSVNDGLPSSQVYDVHLDKDGLVWFATAYGLVKFDGYEFETYGLKHGLRDELIYDIFEDSNKQFWVSTETGGVGKLRSDTVVYEKEFARLDSMLVNYITESPSGEIWFGTNAHGVQVWQDSAFFELNTENGMSSNMVWDIQFLKNNTEVWVATMDGIAIYEEGKGITKTWTQKNGLSGYAAYQAFEATDGTVWVPTSSGITLIEDGELSTITEINGEKLSYVYNISQGDDGVIWIGTERRGLYWYAPDTGEYTHITKKNGLSSNYIYRLIKAIDGTIWIATDGNGVSIFKDKKFKFYDITSEVGTNTITSLYKDKDGVMWYGSEIGLSQYKDGAFKNYPIPEEIFPEDDEIWDIEPLPNGNLQLLTYTYWLIEFDGEKFFRSDMNQPLMEYFLSDVLVEEDGQVWLGSEQGLIKYNNGKDHELIKLSKDYWQNAITYLFEDSNGDLWIGTQGGLAQYKNGEATFYTEKDGMRGQSVYEIQEDSRGNIWVGTNKGISVLKKNGETGGHVQIEKFETDDVYLPETISLVFDNEGGLWQGTNGGLNYYDVEGWYASGSMDKMHYSLGSYGNGVEFNNAAEVDVDGNLWFGTARRGLLKYEFQHGQSVDSRVPPAVYIRDIYANEELIYSQKSLLEDEIHLGHEQNNIEVDFGAVDYKDPYRIFYRYRLNNFEDEWNTGFDIHEAEYTNLEPGTYTFSVMARTTVSDWSQPVISSVIIIKKPFWKTWWFIVCVTATVIGLILLYIDVYVKITEKKKLKDLVDEQTEDLQSALHEKEILIKEIHHRVKNNLAVVSGMLDLQSWQIDDEKVKIALEDSKLRIMTMAVIHEKLYQNEDLANIRIEDFVNDLVYNISSSLKGGNRDITVEQDLQVQELDINKAVPCGLLLNELICNSYEHAFPNGRSGKIKVILKENGTNYYLKVSDNGIGIPKNFIQQERNSLGITLIESLSAQLDGDLSITNGKGTTVTLVFPK